MGAWPTKPRPACPRVLTCCVLGRAGVVLRLSERAAQEDAICQPSYSFEEETLLVSDAEPMSKSLIIAIIASLVSTLVNAKSYTQRPPKAQPRSRHVLLSAVFPCPSDVYHARGAHGQACLRDLTLSSARPAPDQCARRQQA
jgi:hypothetical protein